MKQYLPLTVFCSLCISTLLHAQANQALSNLTIPTAVNTSLLPATDNNLNLGSTSFRWKKLYTADDALINGLTFGRGNGNYITNLAAGGYALNANTTGSNNTATGYASLYFNKTGNNNSAVGYAALYNNVSGSGNTATGYASLYSNTSGYSNTAIGFRALYKTSSQYNLVAVGDSALFNNGSGATASYEALYNTGIGSKALFSNTTGAVNTATGSKALYSNTTGGGNTASGSSALYSNTTGIFNTGDGYNSLYYTTTGDYNTAIGFGALFSNVSGNNNTGIGYGTDVNAGTYNNTTIIGNDATATASNQVRIGNSIVTSIGGYANWTNISDGRVKKNMKEDVPGLAFINRLKPVTYNLDLDAAEKIIHRNQINSEESKNRMPGTEELLDIKEKERIVYSGFVAQQVEQAAKSIGYDFSGVDAAKNDKDLYGLRYAEFVVPMVKAIQELDAAQQSAISHQQQEIDKLKKEIAELRVLLSAISSQQTAISISQSALINDQKAYVEQNRPNPFTGITTINCYLPTNRGNAYINFYNQSGVLLKSVKVTGQGKNTITLNANEFAAGIYSYALVVDGKMVDSKMMVRQ